MRTFLPALLASLLVATTAAAQESAPPPAIEAHVSLGEQTAPPAETHDDASPARDEMTDDLHPGFGARVGGYGFWSPTRTIWDDCPMGGVGVFGTLDVTRHLYVEGALDQYDSTPILGDGDGTQMSRISVLTSGAIGLRMFPEFFVVPHIQLGAGMEWTRVEELSQRVEGIYPLAFLGIGGELNVFRHIKAGADLRFLGMAKPYEDKTQQIAPGIAEGTVRMEMMPAAQGLFYARYVL